MSASADPRDDAPVLLVLLVLPFCLYDEASLGSRPDLLLVLGSADREASLFAGDPSSASPCTAFDCSGFVFSREYDSSLCATSVFVPDFVYSFEYGA